jgi:hypothetical protein
VPVLISTVVFTRDVATEVALPTLTIPPPEPLAVPVTVPSPGGEPSRPDGPPTPSNALPIAV